MTQSCRDRDCEYIPLNLDLIDISNRYASRKDGTKMGQVLSPTSKTLVEFSPIQICTLHIIAPFHLSLWGKSQMMTESVQRLEDDFPLRLFDDAVDKEKLANSIGILAFSYEGGKFNK